MSLKKFRKKIYIGGLAATFLFALSVAAQERESGDEVRSVKIVKVYQGASVKSKVIATLPVGSEFIVVKNTNGNGWCHIKPKNKKSAPFKSGWVKSSEVKGTSSSKGKTKKSKKK